MTAAPYDILIVEDDPTVIVVLGAMLRRFGQVRFAKRGRDALRLARLSVPDLVMLDLNLPDMGGLDVCAAIKASALLADVPVVFLSGSDPGPAEQAAREMGAADFLFKPPQAERLTASVRAQLDATSRDAASPRARGGLQRRGTCNRRRFEAMLALECTRAQASGERLSLLRITLADDAGPEALPAPVMPNTATPADGGERLERLAGIAQRAARRPNDRLGQLGRGELAVLLPDTHARGAACVVCQVLNQAESAGAGLGAALVGVATLEPSFEIAAVAMTGAAGAAAMLSGSEVALEAARRAVRRQPHHVAVHPGLRSQRPTGLPVEEVSSCRWRPLEAG